MLLIHTMRFFVYTFAFCLTFVIVFGSISREVAPVVDRVLKKLGFHCNPQYPGVGPMRKDEVKRLGADLCSNVECRNGGVVKYVSCLTAPGLKTCEVVKGDLSRPYPECCDFFRC